MADILTLRMAELAKEIVITIRLEGMKTFQIRLWVGKKLLKLTAKVIGCGIRIEND